MSTVKLHDILWMVKNAGPSPDDNRRTEIYFAGCQKALSGNPCKNCFNPDLWNNSSCKPIEVKEIVDNLNKQNIPKYVTIVGGEPTDQLDGLIELINLLKENDYNILLFTWRSYSWIRDNISYDIRKKIDIVVTEPYIESERIYNTDIDDGIHNSIGSGNQVVVVNNGIMFRHYFAKNIKTITFDKNNKIKVETNGK